MRRFLVAASVTVLILGLAIPASTAKDVHDLSVTPTKTTDQHDYDELLAAAPTAGIADESYTPSACKQAEHCDTIDVNIIVPANYEYKWSIEIKTSWDDGGADIDTFFWDLGENELRNAATSNNPEKMTVDNIEPERYFLTVLNYAGLAPTYSVEVRFIQGSKNEPKKKASTPAPPPVSGGGTTRPAEPAEPEDSGSVGGFRPAPFSPEFGGEGLPFNPVRVELPDTSPPVAGGVGLRPTSRGDAVSNIQWDGNRVTLGVVALAIIATMSYAFFFLPRRRPARKRKAAPAAT